MPRIYIRLLVIGLLSTLFFGSCADDSSNPSESSGNLPSEVTIIVDKNHANAGPAPCGTEDAVCESITAGLFSAAMVQDGIPTILIKAGSYDKEPAHPIQILMPVILKAELAHEVVIGPDAAFVISTPDVTLEGLTIASLSFEVIQIQARGYATLKDIHVEQPKQDISFGRCSSVKIQNGASAVIERSKLYGIITSEGLLVVNDSIVSSICSSGSLHIKSNDVFDDTTICTLNNNTFSGDVGVNIGWEGGAKVEFRGNTIDGHADIRGGEAILERNTITEGICVSEATLNLTDNIIHNWKYQQRNALWLEYSSATISRNRFGSEFDGGNIIACGESATIQSDGTNTLLNPNCWVDCDGLPLIPAEETF